MLYKRYNDGLIKRCIPEEETEKVYFSTYKTVMKILQAGFYWPNLFKYVRNIVLICNQCQRVGNIPRRNEMPLYGILEVELLDV